jgi:predicted DNA-binding transcriptional regulator AlpA
MSDTDRFLTTNEAAELLKLAPVTLEQWRWRGCGPPFVRFGRAVRYRVTDVRAWADAQRCATSSGRPSTAAAQRAS